MKKLICVDTQGKIISYIETNDAALILPKDNAVIEVTDNRTWQKIIQNPAFFTGENGKITELSDIEKKKIKSVTLFSDTFGERISAVEKRVTELEQKSK